MWVVLSDYIRHLSRNWYTSQERDNTYDRTYQRHLLRKSKMAAADIVYFEKYQYILGRLWATTARWLSAYM